jgi:hypothetical protein
MSLVSDYASDFQYQQVQIEESSIWPSSQLLHHMHTNSSAPQPYIDNTHTLRGILPTTYTQKAPTADPSPTLHASSDLADDPAADFLFSFFPRFVFFSPLLESCDRHAANSVAICAESAFSSGDNGLGANLL